MSDGGAIAVVLVLVIAGGIAIWKRCEIFPSMCKLDPKNDTPDTPSTPEQTAAAIKRQSQAPSHSITKLQSLNPLPINRTIPSHSVSRLKPLNGTTSAYTRFSRISI